MKGIKSTKSAMTITARMNPPAVFSMSYPLVYALTVGV